jgi:hypothetical protein
MSDAAPDADAQRILGKRMRKVFDEGKFDGTVTKYVKRHRLFTIVYTDSDKEEMDLQTLEPLLVTNRATDADTSPPPATEQVTHRALAPGACVETALGDGDEWYLGWFVWWDKVDPPEGYVLYEDGDEQSILFKDDVATPVWRSATATEEQTPEVQACLKSLLAQPTTYAAPMTDGTYALLAPPSCSAPPSFVLHMYLHTRIHMSDTAPPTPAEAPPITAEAPPTTDGRYKVDV